MGKFTGSTLVTAPVEEPLTLPEAKNHLRLIGVNDHDAEVTALIVEARKHVEEMTGYKLISQTWDTNLEELDDNITLPYPEVTQLSSITYRDADDVAQTLGTSNYNVFLNDLITEIIIDEDGAYPTTFIRPDAVTIRFIVGYADRDALPENFKRMIKLYMEWMFYNDDAPVKALNSLIGKSKINWLGQVG